MRDTLAAPPSIYRHPQHRWHGDDCASDEQSRAECAECGDCAYSDQRGADRCTGGSEPDSGAAKPEPGEIAFRRRGDFDRLSRRRAECRQCLGNDQLLTPRPRWILSAGQA
jgi:hypothetical protein